jgi:glycerophosphoryl diester phosphodiesterase
MTLYGLRNIRFRAGDDRIPTFEELLEEVAGRVPLVIELKSNWTGDRRLERRVAETLGEYAGPAAVMSFDPASMRAMRHLLPHARLSHRPPQPRRGQLHGAELHRL